MGPRNGSHKILAVLVGASVLSVGLLAIRMLVRGDAAYGFLAWNLFLAWIPLLLTAALMTAWRLGARIAVPPLLILWLLFFPNAPYVVTDFVHLGGIGGMPRWFDVLLLGSFAATSLAIGFVSLHLVQRLFRVTLGVVWSWVVALTVIALSGIGIYLGRVAQLNSWDALNLERLRAALFASPAHEHGVVLTLFLTAMLAVTYTVAQHLADRHVRAIG